MIGMNQLMNPGGALQTTGIQRFTTYPCPPPNAPGISTASPFVLPGLCNGVCEPSGSNGSKVYTFCHDYLNSVCKRKICKYIHCSKEEEDIYRKTGLLPERLKFLADNGLSVLANMQNCTQEVPVCRDFQRGFCERGDHCKFTHPQNLDGSKTQSQNSNTQNSSESKPLKRTNNDFPTEHEEKEASPPVSGQDMLTTTNSPKLAKLELEERQESLGTESDEGNFDNSQTSSPTETSLVEENRKLKENLSILTKRIDDLTSKNRDLQFQNSKLKSAADDVLRNQQCMNNSGALLPQKMYSPQHLMSPLKPPIQSIIPNPNGLSASPNLCPISSPVQPMHGGPMGPLAVQQIMQQQFSNKVLCQQMVYNAALMSTALSQSNPVTGAYSNPTLIFASQPLQGATSSWTSLETSPHQMTSGVPGLEDLSDHKNAILYHN